MASDTAKRYATIAAWITCGFLLHSVLHSKYLHSKCYNEEVRQLKRLAAYVGGYHHETTAEIPETTMETPNLPEIRVLCWIMTTPENHLSRARHVKATWGRRCTKLIFMSSKEDTELGAVSLGFGEGRSKLWTKSRAAFIHVYKHHFHEADWFFKADDDTYVVMDNLRQMLSAHNSSDPHYFGCHLRTFTEKNETFPDNGYMSGGAGYVVSKEALRRAVENGMLNENTCFEGNSDAEDSVVGKCLEHVGVKPEDSRDQQGYARFVGYKLQLFLPNETDTTEWWFKNYSYNQTKSAVHKCCSESAISYHRVSSDQMHMFEYFIYRLKVHGFGRYGKYYT